MLSPWWVSLIVAAVAYVGLRWLPPLIVPQVMFREGYVQGLQHLAKPAAALISFVALCAFIIGQVRRYAKGSKR